LLPGYLLSLREGIEAALIIGIVLGAVRKINRAGLTSAIWFGALSAFIVSVLAAILLTLFGLELEGNAEPIFEGFTMLLAAGILTWMIFWMNQQSRSLKSELEAGVNKAAASKGKQALFWLAFVAVVREGFELALFLTASVFASSAQQTLLGSILGLGTAALLGLTLFASTVRLDLRHFFQVTGFLLILFAAGLISNSVHEFNEVNLIPAIIEHIWDVNVIVSDTSNLGQLLKALFGYNGNPSLTQMVAYFAYLASVFIALQFTGRKPQTLVRPQA
jgi:high-affinity iron transporter